MSQVYFALFSKFIFLLYNFHLIWYNWNWGSLPTLRNSAKIIFQKTFQQQIQKELTFPWIFFIWNILSFSFWIRDLSFLKIHILLKLKVCFITNFKIYVLINFFHFPLILPELLIESPSRWNKKHCVGLQWASKMKTINLNNHFFDMLVSLYGFEWSDKLIHFNLICWWFTWPDKKCRVRLCPFYENVRV